MPWKFLRNRYKQTAALQLQQPRFVHYSVHDSVRQVKALMSEKTVADRAFMRFFVRKDALIPRISSENRPEKEMSCNNVTEVLKLER